MLDSKLQIKTGQTLALVNTPHRVDVAAPRAAADIARAVLVFVQNRAEFEKGIDVLHDAAQRGALT
jgi:hypothetical protein